MKTLKRILVIVVAVVAFQFGGFLSTIILAGCVGSGDSMLPTLNDNTFEVYLSFPVDLNMFGRDDIVNVDVSDMEISTDGITKRIVGLPGETIEIIDGEFYINGVLFVPDYETIPDNGRHANQPAITLGEDEYYVVGDNRSNSFDSRSFGPIKKSQIKQVQIWHS